MLKIWYARDKKPFTMKSLFEVGGITKQGFHQSKIRYEIKQSYVGNVQQIIEQVREEHPGMGIREIWRCMQPKLGRDEFERIAKAAGYRVVIKRNKMKTTNSKGVTRFDNLITNIRLTHVNQVWVSDITYYSLNNRFYYITLIMDLFSRRIIGYSLSKTLKAKETTQQALNYVIRTRQSKKKCIKTILHSDGGGQYYQIEFRKLLSAYNIVTSMGKQCYENPNAERLNGIIKNYYISRWEPQTYIELQNSLARACLNYNQRPHGAINKMTPIDYEIKYA